MGVTLHHNTVVRLKILPFVDTQLVSTDWEASNSYEVNNREGKCSQVAHMFSVMYTLRHHVFLFPSLWGPLANQTLYGIGWGSLSIERTAP